MDRVKLRQFLFIVFLVAISMKMFMLPTYMMRISGGNSFLVMVIECGADLLLFLAVIFILRRARGDFFETMTEAFGGVIARILAAILALFYLVKIFLMLSEMRIFFSVSVLYIPLSPFHLAPLLLFFMVVAGKKLSVLGRASDIITPFVILSMVLLGVLSIGSIDFTELLPIVGGEGGDPLSGVISISMWFGDFTLLLLFTGKTDARRRIYFSLGAAVLGLMAITLFASMMFAMYKNVPDVLTYGHNISNMTQYSVSSFQFGRFDLLIFSIWLLGILLITSVMSMFVTRCFSFVIKREAGLWSLGVGAVAMLVCLYLFFDANAVVEFIIKYLSYPAIAVQYAFPPLFLIVLIIVRFVRQRREVKREKANEKHGL